MSEIIHHLPVRVALPVPLRRQFDYLAPAPLPAIGCRVRVSFGRQQLVGLVTDHLEQGDLPLADAPHPACAPLLTIQSFYRAINALALRRGHNPDVPPHLNKVTETV